MAQNLQYLYCIQPTRPEMLTDGPTPEEESQIGAHFEYLQKALDAGTLILAGRTLNDDPTCFGVVIFRSASEEEARSFAENDPSVQSGVMRMELFPYYTALISEKNAS